MMKSWTHPASAAPDDQPKRARQITELRRERWPDQRARPGNRRKVMPEENPLVGRNKVAPVVVNLGRRGAGIIQGQQARRDKRRVQTIRDHVATDCRNDEPSRIQRFATVQCDRA